jgi:hypothetical protein
MEHNSNLPNQAFESFLGQDYKACLKYKIMLLLTNFSSTLNKIRSNKELSEKFGYKLHHNLMLTEFLISRMSGLPNFLSKAGNSKIDSEILSFRGIHSGTQIKTNWESKG